MSNRAINAVLDYSKTKGSARLFMVVVADGIGKDTGYYHAKVETLRKDCNCSERYIQMLIGKLLKTNELVTMETPRHATKFAIPILPGEPGYAPEECHSDAHTCAGYHTPLHLTREDVRNAGSARRGPAKEGASQFTLKGEPPFTPHLKPRARVNHSSPKGESPFTHTVNPRSPLGESPFTQYPSSTESSYPPDVPGPSTHQENENGEDTVPHLPAVTPIETVRHAERAGGDTPPPPIAPPPLPACDAIWRHVRTEMEPAMSEPQRREYLDRLKLVQVAPDLAPEAYMVLCPTDYVAEAAEMRWGGHFRAALHKVTHNPDAKLAFMALKRTVK